MSTSSVKQPANSVTDAVVTRRSLRAFTSQPVEQQVLEDIFTRAARAPSGTNMQPWQVRVLVGQSLQRVSEAVLADYDADVPYDDEVAYYPDKFFEPYLSRRRKVGWDLYTLLGISKGDKDKMKAQHRRNFEFFSAPVGAIFTIHRDLNTGSWLDYGMFLQNVMLLAREAGLHTCPQAAFCGYHKALRRALSLDETEIVVCGMSIGYADFDAIENTLETERAAMSDYIEFLG
ncbi:MAG: nitroreductase family protein [Pseudomonadota bacterium]